MNDLFIQGLTIDWNRVRPYNYVRQIPAISGIDTFTFHKPITFFVGENGSGKSTLLEAIAVAYGFNAEGGTKNYSFSTYNSHSELCEAMTISKGYRRPKFGYFLRAESFYNVATKEIDYSDDDHPSKGYHQKSHGESFLAIAQDYMGADGVYIFDEPEAALSPQRQLTLLINIYRCAQEGAQFIIVSHSPILLGLPIMKVSVRLLIPCVDELLEKSLPEDVEKEIEQTVLSFPGVSQPHHLRTRRIGNYYAIELHVRMDGKITLEEAHSTATAIENKLKEMFGKGTHVGIHVEPTK